MKLINYLEEKHIKKRVGRTIYLKDDVSFMDKVKYKTFDNTDEVIAPVIEEEK